MAVDWDYFDTYREVDDRYLPQQGEGENVATQVCTALNKLVYKWYNDGDVFDNTKHLCGWANDLSSYANWLHANGDRFTQNKLEEVWEAKNGSQYEDLLKALCDHLLVMDKMEELEVKEKVGSIYECDGPFVFLYRDEEEDDYETVRWQ